jgi:threonine dehydratase
VIRTPLVRLRAEEAPAGICLKLETLQPVSSVTIRGAASAVLRASPRGPGRGPVTASAGNMAQGIAWTARELGILAATRGA